MSIADILVAKGLLTADQVRQAKELNETKGVRLDHAFVELGFVSERAVLEAMGEQLDIPVVNLAEKTIDAQTLSALPAKLVYRSRLIPVAREDKALEVATCDALDMHALDDLRLLTGLEIRPVLAPGEEIDKFIKAHYGVGGDTIGEMVDLDSQSADGTAPDTDQDLLDMAQEASVIKLVNEIIIEAINERASDIHVEPYETELDIRYRIDGVLQPASLPPQIHRFQAAIVSRIKIMANLNIAEKRLPQDGRIKFHVGGRQIDVRVSVIPMLFGEGVVMRVLDKANVLFTLTQLGMDEATFASFQDLIQRPHGILLVTGPTGSGKTTTLYAALNGILDRETKVLTIEDPVEYHLKGVNQIPVDARVGMTFERGLRAILRHDPDVVMIGEIRDLETARAATQASLTGHLVLSTLHTNDAASAPTRLVDMGVEPFLVSSTLVGSMAQRLVRKLCPKCKSPGHPKKFPAGFTPASSDTLFESQGCEGCRQTGYRGRLGLFELLLMNDAIGHLIMNRTASSDIATAARKSGMRLLREDGWLKAKQGLTTLEEVVKCTAH